MANNDDLPDGCIIPILVLVVLLVIGAVWWNWYRAGIQADIYRRQGIEMSQWEVFIGTSPAERSVILKHKE